MLFRTHQIEDVAMVASRSVTKFYCQGTNLELNHERQGEALNRLFAREEGKN